jgi:hypothetical protein
MVGGAADLELDDRGTTIFGAGLDRAVVWH